MDTSTENVTLQAVFVSDILSFYPASDFPQLHAIVADIDLSAPTNQVPMAKYNAVCDWIADNIGKASIKRAGRKIGETVHGQLKQSGQLTESSTPIDAMKALKAIAEVVIKDPKQRGWELMDVGDKHLTMRRTQTFHRELQLGLLEGLAYKSKAVAPRVSFSNEITNGAEFDEYRITWM